MKWKRQSSKRRTATVRKRQGEWKKRNEKQKVGTLPINLSCRHVLRSNLQGSWKAGARTVRYDKPVTYFLYNLMKQKPLYAIISQLRQHFAGRQIDRQTDRCCRGNETTGKLSRDTLVKPFQGLGFVIEVMFAAVSTCPLFFIIVQSLPLCLLSRHYQHYVFSRPVKKREISCVDGR